MSTVTEDSVSMPALSRGTNGGMKTNSNSSSGEEVRTLFVSGLPMDVRLRELYLLFRAYEGYEGSFLKLISSKPGKIPQPIAFVSFVTRKQAEKALEELQGIHFDPASAQTLRLEFARTNSRVSPKQQPYLSHSSPPLPSMRNGQLSKGSPQHAGGNSPAMSPGGQNLMTLADCWASMRMNNMMSPLSYNGGPPPLSPDSSTAHLSVLSVLSDSESSTYPTPASTPDKLEESSSRLSSTLTVGNLDHRVTAEDISSVFSRCSGFVKVSLCAEDSLISRSPEAIVEFKDPECAKTALEKFQGCTFDWSTGDGIHIDYDSRNPSSVVEFSPSPAMDTSVCPAVSYPPPYNAFQHSSYQTNVQQPVVHMIPKDVNDTLNCSSVLSPAHAMEHYANGSPFMYPGPVFMH